ncbi:MAG: PAS domain-containing sensor histidine kinase [Nitrospinae bacterium]|nr:PAS domain-containing sensor histidine kinase [Nitrospinota bacterium]
MSRFRIASRLTILLPSSVALMGLALALGVLLYWQFSIIPSIRTSEQAKAEVIMMYATHMVEASLEENDPGAIERTIKRLMLMTDPVTGKKLFLGIDVSTVDGQALSEKNDPAASRSFVVSAPFYSQATQDLRGEIAVVYNDYLYKRLVEDARKNLLYILLLIAGGAFGFYLLVNMLLRPLASLADGLSSVNFAGLASLPPVKGYLTGEISQVAIAMTDLFKRLDSAWKSERATEERLQAMTDNTISAIYMRDLEGKFLLVNRQWEKIFSASAPEVIGKTPHDFLPKEMADRIILSDHESIRSGGPIEFEETAPFNDGQPATYLTIKFPIRSHEGKIYAVCGISTDISERKAAEEILRDSHVKLEEMVAKRTHELRVAKERAEEATKIKDRFVSLVSHDLKSPLQSIRFITELMKINFGVSQPPKIAEQITSINQIIEQMVGMIDELLSLSRLQSGSIKLNLELMDCHHMAQDVIEKVNPVAEKKGVRLVNEVPKKTVTYADPHLFYEVLSNIMSNAIKFSKNGSEVTVFAPGNGKGVVAVKDSGVGISEKLLPHLFSMEIKTTTIGTGGEKGSGLGLPLCHEIIRAHGGEILVETQPEKGSVFYIAMPDLVFDRR